MPNLLAFARVLKITGLKVSLSQVIDASHSLEFMDISRKADFRDVLRSNLICRKEEIAIFDRVFDCFWRDWQIRSDSTSPGSEPEDKLGEPEHGGAALEEMIAQVSGEDAKTNEEEPVPVPTYSPVETISRKDFSEMGIDESRAISQAILLIASKIATQMSRRKKRGAKGDEIDPRWTMRRSLKYGGEVVELVSRKRRIKKTRVVLLCDVSGSMDCYSRFLIQFMYGLQNELWGVETFVFSTTLSRITHLIRTREIADALERIAGSVLGWSGGTNIGQSLSMFNREFAPDRVTNRTVVVIISDGWDRGDVSLMEREMRDLKRRCHKIIWLNPLLASENYEPLCKGMQAALPYVDLFLSVHNLNSLVALGRTLQRLVA
ncbi:MAG TPA: VWA domain-containing protein [Candidatus Binatia bacterium]|nr:VWA domain-containing protein [Candidatus Binatia bacterium]